MPRGHSERSNANLRQTCALRTYQTGSHGDPLRRKGGSVKSCVRGVLRAVQGRRVGQRARREMSDRVFLNGTDGQWVDCCVVVD